MYKKTKQNNNNKKKRTNKKIPTAIVLSTRQYDAISEYGVQQVTQNLQHTFIEILVQPNIRGTALHKFSCSQTFLHSACRLRHKHPLNLFTAEYKLCSYLPRYPLIYINSPNSILSRLQECCAAVRRALNCRQTTAPYRHTHGAGAGLAHHTYYSAHTSAEWRTGTELEDL